MKLTSSKLRANSFVLNFAVCLIIYFISACGGGEGGDSWETGSVAFNLQIEDATETTAGHQILQAEFPCEEREIISVSAKVFDEEAQEFDDNDTPLSEGGPWPCETGEGSISGVLAGIDRTLVVDAKDSFDVTIFRGIKRGLLIIANQTTDAGTVILEPVTNRAPVMDPIDDQQARVGELLSFFVTATDVDGDSLTFSADLSQLPGASNPAFDPGTQEFAWTPDLVDAGNYVAVFMVTDDGSPPAADSQEVNIEVILEPVTNRAPVMDPIDDQQAREGELLSFFVTATDVDGDSLTFSADLSQLPGASNPAFDPGTQEFTWTPDFVDAGNYVAVFMVTDDGSPPAADSQEVNIEVVEDNRTPVLDPIDPPPVSEGVLLEFTVTATDPDNDSLTFSADLSQLPGASNPNFDPGTQTFTWTPDFVDAGNYVAVFMVTDDGSPPQTDSQDVNIEVVNDNRAPVLNPIGSQSASETVLLQFLITADDEDAGDVLTFSATSLPTGAMLTDNGDRTATFSWTPTYPDSFNSPFLVRFNVIDDGSPAKSDFEEVTITVSGPPPIP
jgi:hypothetical protein